MFSDRLRNSQFVHRRLSGVWNGLLQRQLRLGTSCGTNAQESGRLQWSRLGWLLAVTFATTPVLASDFAFPSDFSFPGRGNGATVGYYLSLGKVFFSLTVIWMWIWTTQWVFQDARKLQLPVDMWTGCFFLVGVSGSASLFLIGLPGSAGFAIRFLLFAALYMGITGFYVLTRNKRVPDSEKVLTPQHLQSLFFRALAVVGIRMGDEKEPAREGPPLDFVGRSLNHPESDPTRVRTAEQSSGYLYAKELVYDAIVNRSTDVHLEPSDDSLNVRYRIDGLMHESEPMDREIGKAVLNVFKVLGGMDIAESRKPQDGGFGAKLEDREIDFRVATQGTLEGEKLSLRILDKATTVQKLQNVGMRKAMRTEVTKLATLPDGMFICCGPTGAGKSTTLYSCLREIDRFTRNVITIEDPIEYRVDNVTQSEINKKAGQTFASSLRSILRQDPDVIMVGEIRDGETASITCQAATTGHLVLTTLHANDTITALFRLLDLGVEPYSAANALTAILGQRLVRRLCQEWKEPYKPNADQLRKMGLPPEKIDVFYRAPKNRSQICSHCGGTGYYGRTGIFELLKITDRLREVIRENPSLTLIKNEARKGGMIYLQEDGLRQVIRGETSIKELLRVVK